MKRFRFIISLRDARKAQDLLNDERGLREHLDQVSTNVWESEEYDEDEWGEIQSEEYADECLEDWHDEIASFFNDHNIEFTSEYFY